MSDYLLGAILFVQILILIQGNRIGATIVRKWDDYIYRRRTNKYQEKVR